MQRKRFKVWIYITTHDLNMLCFVLIVYSRDLLFFNFCKGFLISDNSTIACNVQPSFFRRGFGGVGNYFGETSLHDGKAATKRALGSLCLRRVQRYTERKRALKGKDKRYFIFIVTYKVVGKN